MDNVADVMGHERLSFVHGDIRDLVPLGEVVADVDVIVNAAPSRTSRSRSRSASEFVTTTSEGHTILLDAIRRTPVDRFILFPRARSTGPPSAPMDEEHPLNPRSPYAATKAAPTAAYAYWTTYDLPIVIVRPFNNYGPYQHPEKVVPRFVTAALRDQPLTVHGDGHASRDWVYVDDVAEAIEAAIAADDDVHGEVINLSTGRDISVEAIADLVLEQLGKPKSLKVHMPERPGQVDRHIGSTARPSACSGGAPGRSFEDGLVAPSGGTTTIRPGGNHRFGQNSAWCSS